MAEQNIWNILIDNGISEAGTAGLMGNLWAESTLQSNIVQRGFGKTDEAYTSGVDNGTITKYTFVHDSIGYGLAQWTYYTRKEGLYDFAKSKGASIGDETLQVQYLLKELTEGYSSLLTYLKSAACDVYTAASRVCTEFERPAVNNISVRSSKAQEFYNKYKGTATVGASTTSYTYTSATTASTTASATVTSTVTYASYDSYADVSMPVLKLKDTGISVGWAQMALKKKGYNLGTYGDNHDGVDCDFGSMMQVAVNTFKASQGIANVGSDYGKITKETWEALLK